MKQTLIAFLLVFTFQAGFTQKHNKTGLQVVYNMIKEAGIEHPEFVMAQCIQETGWLGCKKCCLRYYNLFGFYKKGNKCMKFDSREDCVEYYKKWQDKRYPKWRKKYPKGTYYDFLRYVKYAANPQYNNELKAKVAWVKKNLQQ